LQQRGPPAKSFTGTCSGVLFQVSYSCNSKVNMITGTHFRPTFYLTWFFVLLIDFLTKLILFIYSTLFSLLTGFAAYIFATHHLHSPYGYVIGILSSIIPYYITGFFTHIMAITYVLKSFLVCCTALLNVSGTQPMIAQLVSFPCSFFRVDATFLCYAIDLDTNTCHSNKAHSAFGSSY
jgi:hypothetical protein